MLSFKLKIMVSKNIKTFSTNKYFLDMIFNNTYREIDNIPSKPKNSKKLLTNEW